MFYCEEEKRKRIHCQCFDNWFSSIPLFFFVNCREYMKMTHLVGIKAFRVKMKIVKHLSIRSILLFFFPFSYHVYVYYLISRYKMYNSHTFCRCHGSNILFYFFLNKITFLFSITGKGYMGLSKQNGLSILTTKPKWKRQY